MFDADPVLAARRVHGAAAAGGGQRLLPAGHVATGRPGAAAARRRLRRGPRVLRGRPGRQDPRPRGARRRTGSRGRSQRAARGQRVRRSGPGGLRARHRGPARRWAPWWSWRSAPCGWPSGPIDAGTVVQIAYQLTLLAFPVRAIGWVLAELPRSAVGWRRVGAVLEARRDGWTTARRGCRRRPQGRARAGPGASTTTSWTPTAAPSGCCTPSSLDVPAGLHGRGGRLHRAPASPPSPRCWSAWSTRSRGRDHHWTAPTSATSCPGGLAATVAYVPQSTFVFDDTVRGNITLGPGGRAAGRRRRRGLGGAAGRAGRGLRARPCPRAWTPGWASGAPACPVVSASAWPSPGPWYAARACWCWTTRPAPSTPRWSRRSSPACATTGGVTVVVVAYRRSTISLADHGRPRRARPGVDSGTHAELMGRDESYRNLVEAYARDAAEREQLAAGGGSTGERGRSPGRTRAAAPRVRADRHAPPTGGWPGPRSGARLAAVPGDPPRHLAHAGPGRGVHDRPGRRPGRGAADRRHRHQRRGRPGRPPDRRARAARGRRGRRSPALCAYAVNVRLFKATEAGLATLRIKAFRRIHDLSTLTQNTERRGALVSRVTSDVDTISTFVQFGGLILFISLGQIVVASVLMFVYSWWLALLVWGAFLPLFLSLRPAAEAAVGLLRPGPRERRADAGRDQRGRRRRRHHPRLRRRGPHPAPHRRRRRGAPALGHPGRGVRLQHLRHRHAGLRAGRGRGRRGRRVVRRRRLAHHR